MLDQETNQVPAGMVDFEIDPLRPRTVIVKMPESVRWIHDPLVREAGFGRMLLECTAEPWDSSSPEVARLVYFTPSEAVHQGQFQDDIRLHFTNYVISMEMA